MNKFLLITLFAAAIVGCSHNPPPPAAHEDSRKPSQISYDRYNVRGRVGMTVSKADAGFDSDAGYGDEALYVIQLDCNLDRKLSREEQGRVIKVSAKSTSKKQQRIFAAYKKRSERQNKTGGALPYLQVTLTTENPADLCKGTGIGKVAYGTNPQFSYVK